MKSLELAIPPPFVAAATAGLMWLAAWLAPGMRLELPAHVELAAILGVAGMLVSASGVGRFRRVGTTIDPRTPGDSSALVTEGIYARTRNPMYLGMGLLLFAWALYLAHPLALLGVPLFVLYIDRFQVEPEERALASKFGVRYREYCQRVRRWI